MHSGSTTYQIAKYIKHKKNLTVMTNSIPVVNEFMNSENSLSLEGKYDKPEQSVVAFEYLFNFNEFNILKAFICASGITIEKGISDYNLEEALTRKKIIELSKEVYVAADSTKFGKDVTAGIAPLDKIHYIITDHRLNTDYLNQFKEINTNLIIAKS